MLSKSEIAGAISRKALELGFSACGFAPAGSLDEHRQGYLDWIDSGRAGEMGYLERNIEVRLDPRNLVESAKTVISLAAPYYFPLSPHVPGNPRISRYAMGNDYHPVLKSRGHELLKWIQAEAGPAAGRVFTDSAPIMEREWARRAGLGWIGKNGCLIIPRQGSWLFLTEIITDLDLSSVLSPSLPSSCLPSSHCGSCTRCIDACPTRALAGDGTLDPRRCISYLTIEHKSAIPEEFRGSWSDWVFGCDICQDVCPWNSKPLHSNIRELEPRPSLASLTRETLEGMDEPAFRELFAGTPVERTGWSGILRNFTFITKQS